MFPINPCRFGAVKLTNHQLENPTAIPVPYTLLKAAGVTDDVLLLLRVQPAPSYGGQLHYNVYVDGEDAATYTDAFDAMLEAGRRERERAPLEPSDGSRLAAQDALGRVTQTLVEKLVVRRGPSESRG